MFRQLFLIAGVACIVLFLGVLIINLKPEGEVTVRFVEGVAPPEVKGTVQRQDKFLVVRPTGSKAEQFYSWDKVKEISVEGNFISKWFGDVYDVAEFITRLGALAAAGVFFIGLYQYEQGQQWKRAEFFATAIKDISSSVRGENARLMIDGIKLYPKGRKIKLFPEEATTEKQYAVVSKGKVIRSLKTEKPLPSDETTVAIRDCFDIFFGQLERIDQYIDSKLVSKEAVYAYTNYYIDLLAGNDSDFGEFDRWYLLNYAEFYKFPRVKALLRKYKSFNEPASPPPGYPPPDDAAADEPAPPRASDARP